MQEERVIFFFFGGKNEGIIFSFTSSERFPQKEREGEGGREREIDRIEKEKIEKKKLMEKRKKEESDGKIVNLCSLLNHSENFLPPSLPLSRKKERKGERKRKGNGERRRSFASFSSDECNQCIDSSMKERVSEKR